MISMKNYTHSICVPLTEETFEKLKSMASGEASIASLIRRFINRELKHVHAPVDLGTPVEHTSDELQEAIDEL